MGVAAAKPKSIVTMHQAFDDFLTKRVMGDDPFAIRVDDNIPGCVYDSKTNGGCAIGRYIPKRLYRPYMEGQRASTLFTDHKEIAALFEEPDSSFWDDLQEAHDTLAHYQYVMTHPDGGAVPKHSKWESFEGAIIRASRRLA